MRRLRRSSVGESPDVGSSQQRQQALQPSLLRGSSSGGTTRPPALTRAAAGSSRKAGDADDPLRNSAEFSRTAAMVSAGGLPPGAELQQPPPPQQPGVSPIQGLGALRSSWSNLPVSASQQQQLMLLSLSQERALCDVRVSGQQDLMTLEEQASLVLRRLLAGLGSESGSL
jgi:hypothetical protein